MRPITRADCASVPRPCPWVSCRYHGETIEHSCILDQTSRPKTQEQVATILGLERRQVAAIEVRAMRRLRAYCARNRINRESLGLLLLDEIRGNRDEASPQFWGDDDEC